jgi:hypothetical protein
MIDFSLKKEFAFVAKKDSSWFSDWTIGTHGLLNYIDTKPECRHLKRMTCKVTLQPPL